MACGTYLYSGAYPALRSGLSTYYDSSLTTDISRAGKWQCAYGNKGRKTQTVGSALIGQSWTEPKYLIGRPNSGAPTNQSAVSEEQKQTVAEYVKWWNEFDPETRGKDIPEDLLTASGSGVDPEISPKAAEFQVERIARVRKIPESSVRKLIDKYTTGKTFGILGENRVNVLLVNLELDGYKVE